MNLYETVVDKVLYDTRKHDLDGWSEKDACARQSYIEARVNDLSNHDLLCLISDAMESMENSV